MPSIYLDISEHDHGFLNYYNIKYKRKTYDGDVNFDKLTISIEYLYDYRWHNSYGFTLYIYELSHLNPTITYYPQSPSTIVTEVEAYFSNLHPETPLVLGFRFKGYSGIRYYKYTELKDEILYYFPDEIFSEGQLVETIKIENQTINQKFILTYGSGKNQYIKQIPSDDRNKSYIGKSETFKKVSFMANTNKKNNGSEIGSWLLYECNLLKSFTKQRISKIDNKTLNGFTGQKYHNISVYYTDPENIPLVLEFIEDFNTKRYLILKDNEGKHWKKVEDGNYLKDNQEEKLKEISSKLGEVKYEIDKSQSYEYVDIVEKKNSPESGFTKYTHTAKFKSVTKSIIRHKGSKLKNKHQVAITELDNKKYVTVTVWHGDIASVPLIVKFETTEAGGKEYYKHRKNSSGDYWETTDEQDMDNNGKLKELLFSIQFDFVDSIIILLEKVRGSYGELDISKLPDMDTINRVKNKNITVEGCEIHLQCLNGSCFKTCKHNFSEALNGNTKYGLRFYIPGENTDYNEMTLKDTAEKKQYIYCQNSKNYVYVYFYNQDPRPLLLCYNDGVYKANNKDEYSSKWVKQTDLSSCECTQSSEALKRKLKEISDDLNVVNIHKDSNYDLQKFNNFSIKISVIYTTFRCYSKYSHEHNIGYRFGEIIYKNSREYKTSISNEKDINKVTVYYYTHDKNRANPLMVELELNNSSTREYYELDKDDTYKWKRWSDLDTLTAPDQEEEKKEKLLKKLYDLNVNNNRGNDMKPEDADCIDRFPTLAVALGTSIPLCSGGMGIVIYKFKTSITIFLTRIFTS